MNVRTLATVNSYPLESDTKNGKQLTIDKITALEAEIAPLVTDLNAKQKIYDDTYQDYLDAKAEYETDRDLYIYWNTLYTTSVAEISTLDDEIDIINKRITKYSILSNGLVKPNIEDYTF